MSIRHSKSIQKQLLSNPTAVQYFVCENGQVIKIAENQLDDFVEEPGEWDIIPRVWRKYEQNDNTS